MRRSEIGAFFKALPPNSLYALCDQSLLDQFDCALEAYADRCRGLGAALIQYRNKSRDMDAIAEQLQRLRMLWDGPLLVNDHWRLASLCDGVHVGQEDLAAFSEVFTDAAEQLRNAVGEDAIVGLSTRNAHEIAVANTLPLDYIGLGAYRVTGTKSNTVVLGERLDTLASTSVHPVAAIGGIGFEDCFEHAAMRVMGSALLKRTG